MNKTNNDLESKIDFLVKSAEYQNQVTNTIVQMLKVVFGEGIKSCLDDDSNTKS